MSDPDPRARRQDSEGSPAARPIVVGVDFSEGSAAALRRAHDLAARHGGSVLHVIHVVAPGESRLHEDPAAPDKESFHGAIHLAIRSFVHRTIGDCPNLETAVCSGHVRDELNAYARRVGGRQLVVGQTGRGQACRQRWTAGGSPPPPPAG